MNFERGQDPIKALGLGMYIYDYGFGPRWYVCENWNCNSIRLKRISKGGFQPPAYYCEDCGYYSYAPSWVCLDPKTGRPEENTSVEFKDPYK
jgi:hypothetical protein